MHCLFRDGAPITTTGRYTDAPQELAPTCASRTPAWASGITGCDVATIEPLPKADRDRKRSFFGLATGFPARATAPRSTCMQRVAIPAVRALAARRRRRIHGNADIYHFDKTMIEGLDVRDRSVRLLDQSRMPPSWKGDDDALPRAEGWRALHQNTIRFRSRLSRTG